MMVATKTFAIRYEGLDDEIVAGQSRVDDHHELVAQYPDCWRAEGLTDELQIRSARVDELQRSQDQTRARPLSASGKRELEEARFWEAGRAPDRPRRNVEC